MRYIILSIWCLLLILGSISISQPAWLVNLSETGKTMDAQAQVNEAADALKNNNYRGALESYKKALEIQPQMSNASIGLGITYTKMGMEEKAINIYQSLLADSLQNPYSLYFNLAEIGEKKDKIEEAVSYYEKSAETAPNAFYPYGKIGDIYFGKREWAKAIKFYEIAIQNKPNLKNSYLSTLKSSVYNYNDPAIVQNIKDQLAQGFTPEIRDRYYSERFEKVLNKDKNLANIHNNIGFAYAMQDDIDVAIPYFRLALQIWPNSQRARQDLKTALEIQKQKSGDGK